MYIILYKYIVYMFRISYRRIPYRRRDPNRINTLRDRRKFLEKENVLKRKEKKVRFDDKPVYI